VKASLASASASPFPGQARAPEQPLGLPNVRTSLQMRQPRTLQFPLWPGCAEPPTASPKGERLAPWGPTDASPPRSDAIPKNEEGRYSDPPLKHSWKQRLGRRAFPSCASLACSLRGRALAVAPCGRRFPCALRGLALRGRPLAVERFGRAALRRAARCRAALAVCAWRCSLGGAAFAVERFAVARLRRRVACSAGRARVRGRALGGLTLAVPAASRPSARGARFAVSAWRARFRGRALPVLPALAWRLRVVRVGGAALRGRTRRAVARLAVVARAAALFCGYGPSTGPQSFSSGSVQWPPPVK